MLLPRLDVCLSVCLSVSSQEQTTHCHRSLFCKCLFLIQLCNGFQMSCQKIAVKGCSHIPLKPAHGVWMFFGLDISWIKKKKTNPKKPGGELLDNSGAPTGDALTPTTCSGHLELAVISQNKPVQHQHCPHLWLSIFSFSSDTSNPFCCTQSSRDCQFPQHPWAQDLFQRTDEFLGTHKFKPEFLLE